MADYLPAKTHLTVPPGFRKETPKGCVLHYEQFGSGDLEIQQGFQVTTPFRTLLDLVKVAGERERWIHALKDAAKRGLVTLAQKGQLENL